MENGYQVRVLDKPTVLGGKSLQRGSVVVNHYDHQMDKKSLYDAVVEQAKRTSVGFELISKGLGHQDLPDNWQ